MEERKKENQQKRKNKKKWTYLKAMEGEGGWEGRKEEEGEEEGGEGELLLSLVLELLVVGSSVTNIGQCSVLHAELLAIFLFGIKLAFSRGYIFIRVDYDSKNAIQLLDRNSSRQHHCYDLVEEIHVVYRSIANVSWNHVCRARDEMTKQALSLISDYLVFEFVPDCILSALRADSFHL
ncbi:hypothetical protein JHK82_023878 [Glycine max]|nr:hypothetical protein JHK82_023878 [Glycine max]